MRSRPFALVAALCLGASAACGSGSSNDGRGPGSNADAGAGDPNGPIPFEPVGPNVYVPKVKSLLTGLAATDDEVKAVTADPNALKGLIDGWMKLPSFKVRMLDFLRNAFQQNQVDPLQLMDNLGITNVRFSPQASAQLARNLMDSFPLTVWQMIDAGRPLTDAFTTHGYMMTTAMMSTLAFVDDVHFDDADKLQNRLAQRSAIASYTFDTASANTQAQSLAAGTPTYMVWHFPGMQPAGCTTTSITFNAAGDGAFYERLFTFFMGHGPFAPPACNITPVPQQNFASQYLDTDFSDWRLVTLDANATTGAAPAFFQLDQLRKSSTLSLHAQRMGFFGTLAFDANWGTNATNEARVTANQSLIVALGQSINGETNQVMFPVNATDASHATDPACKGCHDRLDPYKQFFRQSWSLYYGNQTDPAQINAPAGFSIAGDDKTGHGVGDIANIFVANARLPIAWANKLHFWATSTAALEDDPELVRVANAFAGANFDFKTLVRELFSSPLVTWASATQTTTQNGVIMSIARRDQFCAALSTRLGLDDVCGMNSVKNTPTQATIAQRALLMPVDAYYRAFALPSLATNPDLFFRQSTEAICRLVADQVVDAKTGTSKYVSSDPKTAIADFVANVMAIVPSDPRSGPAAGILNDNYQAALASGVSPTDALKSTFTLACIAPTSVVVGL